VTKAWFFLYADKYAGLLHWLLVEATESNEVLRFREVYSTLLMWPIRCFLREAFLLALVDVCQSVRGRAMREFSLWLGMPWGHPTG
jgi:hypothetical protein